MTGIGGYLSPEPVLQRPELSGPRVQVGVEPSRLPPAGGRVAPDVLQELLRQKAKPDPLTLAAAKTYAYANNNPLAYSDPSGNWPGIEPNPIACALACQRAADLAEEAWVNKLFAPKSGLDRACAPSVVCKVDGSAGLGDSSTLGGYPDVISQCVCWGTCVIPASPQWVDWANGWIGTISPSATRPWH